MHLTHSDSWDYFKNAIVLSATHQPFWAETDAAIGYKLIAVTLGCATDENYSDKVLDGSLLSCLQVSVLIKVHFFSNETKELNIRSNREKKLKN